MNHLNVNHTSYTDDELYTLMYEESYNDTYVAYIRGDYCKNKELFLHDIAVALRFPFYFGNNWDALDECLCDLEWLHFRKIMIVIENFTCFLLDNPIDKDICIECMNEAAEYWLKRDIPFVVLLNNR